jgi:hypothetical protein
MSDLVGGVALAVACANGAAALLGAWRWYRVEESPLFWSLLRVGQAAAIGLALLTGGLAVAGRTADDGLFYVYALMPVAIGLVAEQLRLASAETVLEARGIPDAQAVGRLPEDDQRSVVTAILRRELGVMTVAAGVVVFLALRAWGTSAGF